MELEVGTRVRDKNTGAVGTVISVSDFVDLYRVDIGTECIWLDAERIEVIEEK